MRPAVVAAFLVGASWEAGVVTAAAWFATVSWWAYAIGLAPLMATAPLALLWPPPGLDQRMADNRQLARLDLPRRLSFRRNGHGSRPRSALSGPTIWKGRP